MADDLIGDIYIDFVAIPSKTRGVFWLLHKFFKSKKEFLQRRNPLKNSGCFLTLMGVIWKWMWAPMSRNPLKNSGCFLTAFWLELEWIYRLRRNPLKNSGCFLTEYSIIHKIYNDLLSQSPQKLGVFSDIYPSLMRLVKRGLMSQSPQKLGVFSDPYKSITSLKNT